MKSIALEDLVASVILSFCENLAELGCPKDAEPDMWFRYLSPEEQSKIGGKLLDIVERDSKRFNDTAKEVHKESVEKIKAIDKAHKKNKEKQVGF